MSTLPVMRRRLAAALTVLAVTALTGCAKNAPQDLFRPAGPNARNIDEGLGGQRYIFYMAGVVALIVLVAVGYIVVKFRDRGQDIPEQTHGNPKLEIALTILPAIILATVAVPTIKKVFDLADTTDAACIVNVTGQQWWWEYDYPAQNCGGIEISEPIVTSGEMVLPVGTPVVLRITSRDVIHSFWIPRLNGKRDAVPGRLHTLRMEADEPGIYIGQCTEFCGLSHARMRQAVVGLSATDFQTWVDNQLAPYSAPEAGTLAATGEATFIAQCTRCHQVNGLVDADGNPVLANPDQNIVSGVAPNLTNLMTRTGFAGFTFDLVTEECRDELWNASPDEFGALYLQGVWMNSPADATVPVCFDEAALRDWLRNAPAMKPMFVDPTKLASTGGLYRGMPALGLSEAQIDTLIAYLLERK
ncbi:MAG: cytochrome c oxidase subunit II [Ilumatobacteraceae bacterium]